MIVTTFFIFLVLLMWFTKPKESSFNFLCLIRNSYLFFTIYLTVIQSHYFWILWLLALPFEAGLHLMNLTLVPLYSGRNRTKDAYRMFHKIGKIDRRLSNYMAEGYHLEKVSNMVEEQKKKYDWVILEGQINVNTKVLEIGSGHGEMANYIQQKTGCTYVCNTLCFEQHQDLLEKNQKSIYGDILKTNLEDYKNYFDVVLFNGPIEHLANQGPLYETAKKHQLYKTLFERLDFLINPLSKNKKIIIASCIHIRRPIRSIKEFILFPFLLDLCFGGNYPQSPYGLIRNSSRSVKLVKMIDATESYYLYSLWYRIILNSKSKQILKLFLTDIGEILNTPSWFYWAIANWAEQFAMMGKSSPPMQNLWMVLECHSNDPESGSHIDLPFNTIDKNGDYMGVNNIAPLGKNFPRPQVGVQIVEELYDLVSESAI